MECVICYEQDSVLNPIMVLSCCSKCVHDECLVRSNANKCVMCRSPLFVALPSRYASDVEKVRRMELSIPDLKKTLDTQSQYRLDMFVNSVRHVSSDVLFENEYILSTLVGFCDANYTVGKELNSLMHYASCISQRMIVELIKRGANVNCKNALNSTPLTYSLSKKRWDLAAKLLEYGAVVHNKALFSAVNRGAPAFLLGILLSRVNSVKSLYMNKIVHVVHVLITKQDAIRLRAALDTPIVRTLIRIEGVTILIYALKSKCENMVPVLLEAGIPVTAAATNVAISVSVGCETLRLMLSKFQSAKDLYIDASITILHCIIRKSDESILRLALSVPVVRDLLQTEENYLEYVIMHGSNSAAKVLIEAGVRQIGSGVDVANRLSIMRVTDPDFVDTLCCEAKMSASIFEMLCGCVKDKSKCAIALMQDTGRVNSVSVIKKLTALSMDFNVMINGRSLESFTSNKRIHDFIISQKD